jgi:hypothetical protein
MKGIRESRKCDKWGVMSAFHARGVKFFRIPDAKKMCQAYSLGFFEEFVPARAMLTRRTLASRMRM